MTILKDYWFKLLCLAALTYVAMYWADAHRYVIPFQETTFVLDTRTGSILAPHMK